MSGWKSRAAAVCVRDEGCGEVMLVSGRRGEETWIFPGGGVEAGESAAVAARREAKEEAGVSGTILRELGCVRNEAQRHSTQVFLLRVEDEDAEWPEKETLGRRRHWCSQTEAQAMIKPSQRAYFDLLAASPPPPPTGQSSSTSPCSATPTNTPTTSS